MPILFEKSFERLQGEAMNQLLAETNITRTSPGAKARTLLKVVNRKLNKAYQEFDVNLLKSFLPFAQGQFLDYLGDMLGVPRAPALRASAAAADKLVRFYVDTAINANFGAINNNNDIFIPSGTQISSGPNGTGVVYSVNPGVFLNRLDSEQYVACVAVQDGSSSNVGQGLLTNHNFVDYTAVSGLLVTNDALIDNGRSLETDTNYRFRIANQTLASERANSTAIRLAVLSVPGVSDIVLRRYARGIGTSDILIRAVVPNTPDSLIKACQNAISRVQAEGCDVRAEKPRLTGLSFQISVTWRQDASTSDRETIRSGISSALSDYVNNLGINETFIVNEAIERVMSVDSKILNIGTAQKAFDLINLYKETKLRDNRIKEELLNDYTPQTDERIIIELSLETPIVIIDKN